MPRCQHIARQDSTIPLLLYAGIVVWNCLRLSPRTILDSQKYSQPIHMYVVVNIPSFSLIDHHFPWKVWKNEGSDSDCSFWSSVCGCSPQNRPGTKRSLGSLQKQIWCALFSMDVADIRWFLIGVFCSQELWKRRQRPYATFHVGEQSEKDPTTQSSIRPQRNNLNAWHGQIRRSGNFVERTLWFSISILITLEIANNFRAQRAKVFYYFCKRFSVKSYVGGNCPNPQKNLGVPEAAGL